MGIRAQREQIEALARDVGAGPLVGSSVAWLTRDRRPLVFRRRRRGLVVRAGDELLLVGPRRRGKLRPDDVVARLAARPGSLRSQRRLGLLRQLVVEAPDGGAPHVIELPLRSRRFTASLAEALR